MANPYVFEFSSLTGGVDGALDSLNTTSVPDASHGRVDDGSRETNYVFSSASSVTADGLNVIDPLVGPGQWLLSSISRKNIINIKDYDDDVGDGSTATDTAYAAAKAALVTNGGGTLLFPAGIYAWDTTPSIDFGEDNIKLQGEGIEKTVWLKKASTDMEMLQINGSLVTTEAAILGSNAAQGDQSLTLDTGKGALFTAGADIILFDDSLLSVAKDQQTAEMVNIFSISTDTLTLSRPLKHSYTTADNAEVQNVNWIDGFELDGIGFDGNSYATGGGNGNNNNFIECLWSRQPKFTNIGMWEAINFGLGLGGCLEARIDNLYVKDFLSNGVQGNSGSYGYAVVELGLNEGLIANNIQTDRVRHSYTTATLGIAYGEPEGSRITNGVARNCRGSGWDTHAPGRNISFVNCITIGSLQHCFQDRATNTVFSSCYARDCIGAAIYITTDAEGCRLESFDYTQTNQGTVDSIDWTARAAIYDLGTATTFDKLPADDFTPVFSDASSAGNAATGGISGRYQLNEGWVDVWFRAVNLITTSMTGSNALYIQSLPFAAKAATVAAGSIRTSAVTKLAQVTPSIEGGNTYMTLEMDNVQNRILVSDITSGSSDIYINIRYEIEPN